jgi:hypothetical protein
MPAIVAVIVFLVCVGLSAWNIVSLYEPKVEKFLDYAIGQYDTMVPEITIEKGKASIKEKQPFYLNDDPEKGAIVVIDTRSEAQKEILNRAKDSDKFIALTQDYFIAKDGPQNRILPLKNIPDITVNAELLEKFMNEFYPSVVLGSTIAAGIWYLFTKLIQILIMALLFYSLSQKVAVPPTYGQSFKIATFVLIAPVALDMYLSRLTIGITVSWSAYLVIYLAVMAIAYWDFINEPHRPMDRQAPINP